MNPANALGTRNIGGREKKEEEEEEEETGAIGADRRARGDDCREQRVSFSHVPS